MATITSIVKNQNPIKCFVCGSDDHQRNACPFKCTLCNGMYTHKIKAICPMMNITWEPYDIELFKTIDKHK